ncbi:MAG: hypothetical protein P8189_24480 [Anaerolineae bacterium]
MSRKRFIVVFILLVVILLVASAVFGVLTYGLNTQEPLDPTPEPGSTGPMGWATLAGGAGPPSSGKLEQPSGPGSASLFVL